MERTRITVHYQHTHNLGNYSNCRPGISIEATLGEGDDPEVVKAVLHSEAQAYVHEAIDQALEATGQRAHFSSAPRYAVLSTHAARVGGWRNEQTHQPPESLVAVVPDALVRVLRPVDATTFWRTRQDGLRELHALREASAYAAEHPGTRTVACLDGDLTRLPLWALEAIPEPTPVPESVGPMLGDDGTAGYISPEDDEEYDDGGQD